MAPVFQLKAAMCDSCAAESSVGFSEMPLSNPWRHADTETLSSSTEREMETNFVDS